MEIKNMFIINNDPEYLILDTSQSEELRAFTSL